jgi:hypothetical protein
VDIQSLTTKITKIDMKIKKLSNMHKMRIEKITSKIEKLELEKISIFAKIDNIREIYYNDLLSVG